MNDDRFTRIQSSVVLAAVSLVLGLGVQAGAQVQTAAISGRVTDPTSAVIVGAQVEIRNTETGIANEVKTNAEGIYVAPSLKPGSYVMNVDKLGFRTVSVTGLTLNVQDDLVRNFVLQVGSSAESITVTAADVGLQTGNSQLGTVISERAVADLPLNGRNFTQLLTLTPGATPVSTSQGANLGSDDGSTVAIPGSSFSNPSIHGQWNRSTVYLLDGAINTDFRTTTYTILPIVDTIREFKLQSHNDGAEFGMVLGGTVNLISKSGTNGLHGSAWEFVRNNAFDARNKFNDLNGDGTPRAPAPYHQNEFGGALGGPIFIPKLYNGKNKTFFYFGYEGWRYNRAANSRYRVPTSTELSGNFSSANNTLSELPIYDPATTTTVGGVVARQQFLGNIIPSGRIDKMVQGYLQTYFDQPNLTGDSNYNVINRNPNVNTSNSYSIKIDETISDSDSGWFRYSRMNVAQLNPQTIEVTQSQAMQAKNIAGGWVHVFNHSLLADVQGGYAARPFTFQSLPKSGSAAMQSEGWTGLDTYGLVAVSLAGPWGGSSISNPALRGNPNWSVSGNLSWTHSAHTFRSGFMLIDQRRTQSGNGQSWTFDSNQTADLSGGNSATTGASLASALLGLPANGSFALNNVIDYSFKSWGTYFQDTWKANPNLTLNLGLRFDHVNQPTLTKGLQTSLDNTTGNWEIGGGKMPPSCDVTNAAPCIPDNVPFSNHIIIDPNPIHGPNPIWNNIGPRAGIAWSVTPKIVVRGGYGLVFDTLSGLSQTFSNSMNSWPASGASTKNYNAAGTALTTVETAQTSVPANLPSASPWGNSTWYYDANHKNAYSHQWNVEIQRQMASKLLMSVAYVGSKTADNDLTGYANTAAPSASAANVQDRTPFPWIGTQYFYSTSKGKAHYNAFEFKAQRSYADGLQYLIAYTWSKATDNGASGWFASESGAGGALQDFNNPDGSRGVSGYDIPHFLSISGTYDLPVGKGKRFLNTGPASWLVGNWQINTVTQLRSGKPYSLIVPGDPANIGSGISWYSYARPNLVGNPHPAHPSASQWFNPAAFVAPVGAFGTYPRNALRSAPVYNSDISLFKRFPVGDLLNFEFRAEAFNAFNLQNLDTPNTTLFQSNTGQITGLATQPRELQFALKALF